MRGTPSIGALFLLCGIGTAARANLLVNGSLESAAAPAQPDNLVYVSPLTNTAALPGWTVTTGTVDIVPSSYWQSTNGGYSLDLVGTPGLGSIRQHIAATAANNYLLTFDFSANPQRPWQFDETNTTKILLVQALGASGSLLAQQIYMLKPGTRTTTDMQYLPETFNFTADGAAATLVMSAVEPMDLPLGQTRDTMYCGPVIDNLDLISTGTTQPQAPEPATLALLGIGGVALLGRRRRLQ